MRSLSILFAFFVFFVSSTPIYAQSNKKANKKTSSKNPATFTISKNDFDLLLSKKAKEVVSFKDNKFLDKSVVEISTLNGDMKFLRVKLSYFPNAFLMAQVNGDYSTQIFILSEDKSVSYKGRIEKRLVTMTKCNEDEIVSE